MCYLKSIVFILILIVLGILLEVRAQKTEGEHTTATEEISLEQFIEEFVTSLQANDSERIQQLITENPNIVKEAQQRLKKSGESSGKVAEQSRTLVGLLEEFLSGDFRFILDRLYKAGFKACDDSYYFIALEKWQTGLKHARTLNDKDYIGLFLTHIGSVYIQLRHYEEALRYLAQALTIYQQMEFHYGEGTTLTIIGKVYFLLGHYDQALKSSKRALEILRKSGDRSMTEGEALVNIGQGHSKLGDYEQALEFLGRALVIHRMFEDHRGEGRTLNLIGHIFLLIGQPEQALRSFQQALVIFQGLGEERQSGEGASLAGIGLVYGYYEENEQTLRYLQQALAIFQQFEHLQSEASCLGNIGLVYNDQKKYQQALSSYQIALSIHRKINNKHMEGVGLTNIGNTYTKLGEYGKAYSILQDSIGIHEALGTTDSLWKAQGALARVEIHFNQTESAIAHYEQALDNIERLRAGFTEKEYNLSFMHYRQYVYDEFIDFLQDLQQQYPDKGYDRKALETFERKQGRVFLEEMGKSGARLFAGIPEAITQRKLVLELELEQTRKRLVDEWSKSEQDKELIHILENHEKALHTRQKVLKEQIKTKYPGYYALQYPKPVALPELQQEILQHGELTLAYGVMEKQTVLWVIGNESFKLFSLNISESDLQKEIETFRKFSGTIVEALNKEEKRTAYTLANKTLGDTVRIGYSLYQKLFPKEVRQFIKQAETLYIVPTGPLYGLPFEALVTEASKDDRQPPHYLIHDTPIAYLSSASLLKILRDAQARRKQGTHYPLLAFANPVYDEQTASTETPSAQDETTLLAGLSPLRWQGYLTIMGGPRFSPLPETEELVREIASILKDPTKEDESYLQLGEQASRQNVLNFNKEERLDEYRYLLFAAHGILPEEVDYIHQPAIVLSHPNPETGEGFLTMADAFGLQLNADLVVLSACNTGRGEQIRGEGIMGLTRAFMYAGTPAVSVTLWKVESKVAVSKIYTCFFKHLHTGDSLAVALQQAKLDFLEETEEDSDLKLFRHPCFWAPFVVFGDGSNRGAKRK